MSQVEGAVDSGAADVAAEAAQQGATGDAGGTLLTKKDGGEGVQEDGQAKGEGEKAEDEAKAPSPEEVVPDKPEGYELTFDEAVQVDEALAGNFKALAHELKISQGQAQKLADFYVKQMEGSATAAHAAQVTALDNAQRNWEAEITSRPEFKQEVADAKRTLKEFGGPQLQKLMDESRLGSHPVFFDFVAKVGKALAEPEIRGAGMGNAKPSAAKVLYPDME